MGWMNIRKALKLKSTVCWVYTTTLLLTLSSVLNFNFFNEFNPGGSNSTTQTPVGPASFSVAKEMFPGALTPEEFVKDFDIRNAQTEGHYGLGETIGFIEVDGEFSQKAFDAFNRKFGLSSTKVTILPQSVNLGVQSKEQVVETMVDVEWAHVVAPKANLVIFDTSKMDEEQIASAISKYHVSVLSDSTQFQDVFENARDPFIKSKMADILSLSMSHPYFTGSGDGGPNVAPASLYPNAVIVGGIQDKPQSDIQVWNSAGFGTATDMAIAPRYQRRVFHNIWRHVPDVTWFAGPLGIYTNTPVGWLAEEGTSLSAPLWAALWSLGDAAHRLNTDSSLPSDANAVLYALYDTHPNAFNSPNSNGMPSESIGLGYPNASQIVKDLGNFKSHVTQGNNLQFYRLPFYLAFIELGFAILAVSFWRTFKSRRAKAVSIVVVNTIFTLLVMIIICTLCNNLEANVIIRDVAFTFMATPYVFLIYRIDKWVWNLKRRPMSSM